MKIICFHNPNEENGYLSNWYRSSFVIENIVFSSVEQFMMYRKAICFQDKEIVAQILDTGDAILAECAVKDLVWEIGFSMKDPERFERTKWKGKNLHSGRNIEIFLYPFGHPLFML